MNRRTLLASAAGTAMLAAAGLLLRPLAPRPAHAAGLRVSRTDAEWRALLTPVQYDVLRRAGTEPPGSSPLNQEHRPGVFACAGCDAAAFRSEDKFDSGTGWPSFTRPIEGAVATSTDDSWLAVRTEVRCASCGGHFGHVFPDGPRPTGLRYCMNGAALQFHAA